MATHLASPETGRLGEFSPPGFFLRLRTFVYHGARILFLPWPRYTFDDLAAIQDTLDGPAFRRAAERMAADPEGTQILRARPEIRGSEIDFDWLESLPPGTLGHEYWRHFATQGMLEAVKAFRLNPPLVVWEADTEYAKKRYRETHDVRHVLLGLGVEGYEEVLLQCFQFSQLPQALSAGIVIGGSLKHGLRDWRWRELWRLLPRAWRAGKRARFLSLVNFEQHWERSLDELRQELGVEPVGDRYPRRTDGQSQ